MKENRSGVSRKTITLSFLFDSSETDPISRRTNWKISTPNVRIPTNKPAGVSIVVAVSNVNVITLYYNQDMYIRLFKPYFFKGFSF